MSQKSKILHRFSSSCENVFISFCVAIPEHGTHFVFVFALAFRALYLDPKFCALPSRFRSPREAICIYMCVHAYTHKHIWVYVCVYINTYIYAHIIYTYRKDRTARTGSQEWDSQNRTAGNGLQAWRPG